MSITPHIQSRTRLFARVLGPYLFIAALTMIGRTAYMRSMIEAFSADAVWPWVAGAFVLPMGLAVIVLHPYWRGPSAAIVSLLGWLSGRPEDQMKIAGALHVKAHAPVHRGKRIQSLEVLGAASVAG